MRLLLIACFCLVASVAHADILVRHCDTPTAMGCAVASIWVKPSSALNVQVNRVGAPFVKLTDVQPSERIAACYNDPAIAAGSSAKCSVPVPGRTDQWELKSTLYPPDQVVGQITLQWEPSSADTNGQPFADVAGYVTNRQQDVCLATSADPRCGTMPWITEDVGNVTQKVFAGLSGRWCFTMQAYTAAHDLGTLSTSDTCQTAMAIKRLPGPPKNIRATAP